MYALWTRIQETVRDLDHVIQCQHPGSNIEKTKLGPLIRKG